MIKIVGKFANVNKYLVVDEYGVFTIISDEVLRRALEQMGDKEIDVLSMSNFTTRKIKASRCLLVNGLLTRRGNLSMEIIMVIASQIPVDNLKINNYNLGKAVFLQVRATHANDTDKDYRDYVVVYLVEKGYLGVMPFGNIGESGKPVVYNRTSHLSKWIAQLGGNFEREEKGNFIFKLCGKSKGYRYSFYQRIEDSTHWYYGIIQNGVFSVIDIDEKTLPVTKLLDNLERAGIVDIPILNIGRNLDEMYFGFADGWVEGDRGGKRARYAYARTGYEGYKDLYHFDESLFFAFRQAEGIKYEKITHQLPYVVRRSINGYYIKGYNRAGECNFTGELVGGELIIDMSKIGR